MRQMDVTSCDHFFRRGVGKAVSSCPVSMQVDKAGRNVPSRVIIYPIAGRRFGGNGNNFSVIYRNVALEYAVMQDDLITTKGICLANTSYLRDFFKTNKVPVYLETSLSEIGDGAVTLKDKEGKTFEVNADSVILSVGYNPAPAIQKGRHVHVIGDAAKVGNLRTVIWGAWDVCMKL